MPRRSDRLEPGDVFHGLARASARCEWVPVFTDKFDRPGLGPEWLLRGATAAVNDGWLRLKPDSGGDAYAVVRQPFPDNIKVKYRARFPAEQDVNSDLSCFIGGTEEHCDARGYCLAFAANRNTCTRVQREGVDLRINTSARAEPGVAYEITAEIIDGNLSLYVDGKAIVSYLDLLPLCGEGHDRLGLATFGLGAEFSDFRVLKPTEQPQTGIFADADTLCRSGQHDMAIDSYDRIATSHAGQLIGLLARCKIALALMSASRWTEAEALLRELGGFVKNSDLDPLCALWRARCLGMMGKIDDALRLFSRVQATSVDPGVVDETAVSCGLMAEALRADGRWLESGLCAKFMFEKLKTPLLETGHMFNRYANRLSDAALYEEDYLATTMLSKTVTARMGDPLLAIRYDLRRAHLAILTDRRDVADDIYERVSREAAADGDRSLAVNVDALKAALDLATGDYERAVRRLAPLAGTPEDKMRLDEASDWGGMVADIRMSGEILLGGVDEVLRGLVAVPGAQKMMALDLRMILAAELRLRGDTVAAAALVSSAGLPKMLRARTHLVDLYRNVLVGDATIDELREWVDSHLSPASQPAGLVVSGMAAMATGNAGAAILAWSDARNSAIETTPAWHWAGYGQKRVSS